MDYILAYFQPNLLGRPTHMYNRRPSILMSCFFAGP